MQLLKTEGQEYISALLKQKSTIFDVCNSNKLTDKETRLFMAGYQQAIEFLSYLVNEEKEHGAKPKN